MKDYSNYREGISDSYRIFYVNPEYKRIEGYSLDVTFKEKYDGKYFSYVGSLNKFLQDDTNKLPVFLEENWEYCKNNTFILNTRDYRLFKSFDNIYRAGVKLSFNLVLPEKDLTYVEYQKIEEFFDSIIFTDKALEQRLRDEIPQNGTTTRSIWGLAEALDKMKWQEKVRETYR